MKQNHGFREGRVVDTRALEHIDASKMTLYPIEIRNQQTQ
jgi:hypothetical protein